MEIQIETAKQSIEDTIRQQLVLLIATPEGTVVFDRNFGINITFIDMPYHRAVVLLTAELSEKIRQYIPSVTLKEIKVLEYNLNGLIRLKVVVDYGEQSF